MLEWCIVGLGGFVGAALRYAVTLLPLQEPLLQGQLLFPVKTLAVNVAGCAAIGVLSVLAAKAAPPTPRLLLFLKTGVCGGFTTFSTFALESATLVKSGHALAAAAYIALSVAAGVAVIFAVEALEA